jgi:hypothetical protein
MNGLRGGCDEDDPRSKTMTTAPPFPQLNREAEFRCHETSKHVAKGIQTGRRRDLESVELSCFGEKIPIIIEPVSDLHWKTRKEDGRKRERGRSK